MSRTGRGRRSHRERGLAMILFVTMLALGTTYVLVDQMNGVSQKLAAQRANDPALTAAREALIGYAALQASNGLYPGSLPCPDTNNDGNAEGSCSGATLVGRLPWKTLGLTDLRDSSGERLWYALSSNFRNQTGSVINSNTVGQLTVYDGSNGTVSESQVVAIVFAPGPLKGTQTRDVAGENTMANYLEGARSTTEFGRARPSTAYPQGQCYTPSVVDCNDQLLELTASDLFAAVEPVVTRRLQTSIVPRFADYTSVWGTYPLPVPFTTDPETAQSNLLGVSGTLQGWLPLMADRSQFTWSTTATVTKVSGAATLSGLNCTATTAIQISCRVRQRCGAAVIQIAASLPKVGLSFFTQRFSPTFLYSTLGSSYSLQGTGLAGIGSHTITHSLQADGSDTILYQAPLASVASCVSSTTRTLTLPAPSQWPSWGDPVFANMLTAPSTSDPTFWFIQNQWYKQTLYAIASGMGPGGAATCTPPNCLSVTLPDGTVSSDKRVILMIAGRALSNQSRSTAGERTTASNYFEQGNATIADRAFGIRKRDKTFNDGFAFVSPSSPTPP